MHPPVLQVSQDGLFSVIFTPQTLLKSPPNQSLVADKPLFQFQLQGLHRRTWYPRTPKISADCLLIYR